MQFDMVFCDIDFLVVKQQLIIVMIQVNGCMLACSSAIDRGCKTAMIWRSLPIFLFSPISLSAAKTLMEFWLF